MQSETSYARSGDLHIAYAVLGEGPPDIALIDQWFSNVDALRRLPPLARFADGLSRLGRVILLDKRGTGLSDPVPLGGLPTLEEWMDDLRAVFDAVDSNETVLVSGLAASYVALLFAATHPERTSALVLVDGSARITPADRSFEGTAQDHNQVERIRAGWGRGVLLDFLAPAEGADPVLRRSFAEYERASASPGVAAALMSMLWESDVRHVLPTIRVPTLVVTHKDSVWVPPASGRTIAERIPGAHLVELPGESNLIWAGDQDAVMREITAFLSGTRPVPETDRVLATVLFTDIVDSTRIAAQRGDAKWRTLLAMHHEIVRDSLAQYRGREVKTTGDGFFAVFDGPARGIRCAAAIRERVHELGIDLRAGLHTGEVELIEADVGGIAVHIGARIAALAGAGEIFVSSTVKDLVVGSGIVFTERGTRELKGVPGVWQVYSVASVGR